jgi:hypothetical protein
VTGLLKISELKRYLTVGYADFESANTGVIELAVVQKTFKNRVKKQLLFLNDYVSARDVKNACIQNKYQTFKSCEQAHWLASLLKSKFFQLSHDSIWRLQLQLF